MFTIEDKDIFITSGDTGIIDFVINDEFQEGDVVTLAVKKRKTQNDYDILVEAAYYEGNLAKIFLDDLSTKIPKGRYYYDIQINFADGRIDTVINNEVFQIGGEIFG